MPISKTQRRLSYIFTASLFSMIIGTTVMCSGTRPSAPSSPPATPTSVTDSWLCATSPTIISLQELGVPADSQPVDLAISPNRVTVLLRPARLVTFSRDNPQTVDMIVGQEGDSWGAIDRDPTDGSLWVASEQSVSLLRVSESGEHTLVAGPKVEGRGRFYQIRIATDAIYATPTGSANTVWRLSRDGKLLDQAFPQPKEDEEPSRALEVSSGVFRLARDFGGNVVALHVQTGQLYRANADGTWVSLPDRFPGSSTSHAPSLHGEAVGTSSESWSFTRGVNSLLFLPEGPAVLGSPAFGRRFGSALRRIKDGKVETAIEYCAGNWLLAAVSDSLGFAAVSSNSARIEKSGERRISPARVIVGRFHAASSFLIESFPRDGCRKFWGRGGLGRTG